MKSNREGKFNMGLLIPKWESSILWDLSAVIIEWKNEGDDVYLRHMYFMWSLYIHLFNTNLLSSYLTITDYKHLDTVMKNTDKLLTPCMGFII